MEPLNNLIGRKGIFHAGNGDKVIAKIVGYDKSNSSMVILGVKWTHGWEKAHLTSNDYVDDKYLDLYDRFVYASIDPKDEDNGYYFSDGVEYVGKMINSTLLVNGEKEDIITRIVGYNIEYDELIIGIPSNNSEVGWSAFYDKDILEEKYLSEYNRYLYLSDISDINVFRVLEDNVFRILDDNSIEKQNKISIEEYLRKVGSDMGVFMDKIIGSKVTINKYGRTFDTIVVGYEKSTLDIEDMTLIVGIPELHLNMGWSKYAIDEGDFLHPDYENKYEVFLYVGISDIDWIYDNEFKREIFKQEETTNGSHSKDGFAPILVITKQNNETIKIVLPTAMPKLLQILEKIRDDYNIAGDKELLLIGTNLIFKKSIKDIEIIY